VTALVRDKIPNDKIHIFAQNLTFRENAVDRPSDAV